MEFHPTPNQLWNALQTNYNVDNTLIVQFDQDEVDQCSRLASTLTTIPPHPTNINEQPPQPKTKTTDVKFARLKGIHLSPINNFIQWKNILQINTNNSNKNNNGSNNNDNVPYFDRILQDTMLQRGRRNKNNKKQEDLQDLIQSTVKYIDYVLDKPTAEHTKQQQSQSTTTNTSTNLKKEPSTRRDMNTNNNNNE